MKESELISTYPRLWHVTHDGSWPSIMRNGLLSASKLLDACGYNEAARSAIENARRPTSLVLSGRQRLQAVLRDQKPMSDSALDRCLQDGLQPSDWYAILNSKVFFWLSRNRLKRLMGARVVRAQPQIAITLATESLVKAHRDRIRLSPMNSGSTIRKALQRGLSTFLPIDEYPFEDWRRRRGRTDAVVELAVEGGVPDVMKHVLSVHRVHMGVAAEIWVRADIGASGERYW